MLRMSVLLLIVLFLVGCGGGTMPFLPAHGGSSGSGTTSSGSSGSGTSTLMTTRLWSMVMGMVTELGADWGAGLSCE